MRQAKDLGVIDVADTDESSAVKGSGLIILDLPLQFNSPAMEKLLLEPKNEIFHKMDNSNTTLNTKLDTTHATLNTKLDN